MQKSLNVTCVESFDGEIEGKLHRKTYSFKSTFVNTKKEQACKNCDSKCKYIYTMEVYIGKCYPNNFVCGFCD